MRKLLVLLIIAGSLVALAIPAIAQTGYDISLNTINDDEFPRLQLLLTVMDGQEQPVLGLTEADFEVLLDNQAVEVVSVEEIRNAELGVSVVLVLDTSESMYSQPLENTKAAANVLIDNLRPQDELAIVEFDSEARVIQPFSSDFEAARAAIEGLTADGKTAMYEATYRGVEQALTSNNPRRIVIIVTDGHEYGDMSTVPAEAAPALAAENNVPLFPVGFGYVYEPYLRGLAESTDGQAFILPDSERLPEIFDFIANYLRSQYIVTVEPDIRPDGAAHDVTVRVGDGQSAPYSYTAPDFYPVIELSGAPEGEVSASFTLAANVTAPRGIDRVEAAAAGFPLAPQNEQATGTTYSAEYTINPYELRPGENTAVISAYDNEDGTRSSEVTFTVASLPTEFTLDLPAGTLISEATRPVTVEIGQAQGAVDQVSFSVDGGPPTALREAPYTYTIDSLALGEGPHTLEVLVQTALETSTTQAVEFEVDAALFVTPTATPTNTPPPTATPIPTNTPLPTETPAPTEMPTSTPEPTATSVPPTDTLAPTETPVVPTATDLPDTAAPYAFTFSGLEQGMVLTEPVTVEIDPGEGATAIQSVEFSLDEGEPTTVDTAPFAFELDPGTLTGGDHSLGITATGADDSTGTLTIPFVVAQAAALVVTDTTAAPPVEDTAEPAGTDTAAPAATDTEAPAATDTSTPYRFMLSGLEPGIVLTGPTTTIGVEPEEGQPRIESVTFTLDGETATELSAAPYIFELDNVALGDGEHELGVTVSGAGGLTGTQVIPFSVAVEPTPEPTLEPTATPPGPIAFNISGLEPDIVLTEPTTTIGVEPEEGQPVIESVTFTLDGETAAELNAAPYIFELDNAALGNGEHELGVVVSGVGDTSGAQVIPFSVALEPTAEPPAPVEFNISGLQPGAALDTPETTVEVIPAEGQEVASVTFAVDGAEGETISEPPYQITLDNLALGAGEHELTTTVERVDGETGSASVDFSVADSLFEGEGPTAITAEPATRNDLLIIGGVLLLLLLLIIVWQLTRKNNG